MAVVIKGKLVFLEHPRTASTAVRDALKKIGGQPHTRHTYIKAQRGEVTLATVRIPYDVEVCWWLIKTFKEFILGCHDQFMTKNGRLIYYHKHVNVFLQYETLQFDLNIVLDSLNLPTVKLKKYNETKGKRPFDTYYTAETVAIVERRFGQELKEYCYGLAVRGGSNGSGTNE